MSTRKHASFGVFVSSKVVAEHDRNDLRRLCFSSTSSVELPHREVPPEDLLAVHPEAMDQTYDIGAKPTKYMGIMGREAPPWARDSCTYSKNYRAFPLADSAVNKMIASHNNPSSRKLPPPAPVLVNQTAYGTYFTQGTPEERRACKWPYLIPPTYIDLTMGAATEHRSASHVHHAAPSPEAARQLSSKGFTPINNLALDGAPQQDFLMRSTYDNSFSQVQSKSAKSTTWRKMGLSHSSPNLTF